MKRAALMPWRSDRTDPYSTAKWRGMDNLLTAGTRPVLHRPVPSGQPLLGQHDVRRVGIAAAGETQALGQAQHTVVLRQHAAPDLLDAARSGIVQNALEADPPQPQPLPVGADGDRILGPAVVGVGGDAGAAPEQVRVVGI